MSIHIFPNWLQYSDTRSMFSNVCHFCTLWEKFIYLFSLLSKNRESNFKNMVIGDIVHRTKITTTVLVSVSPASEVLPTFYLHIWIYFYKQQLRSRTFCSFLHITLSDINLLSLHFISCFRLNNHQKENSVNFILKSSWVQWEKCLCSKSYERDPRSWSNRQKCSGQVFITS